MTTIRDTIKQHLVAKVMFESQADEVVEAVIAAPENEAMAGRWDEDTEGYPDVMMRVLLVSAKTHALEWIDANCPKAWYRPMFAKANP